MQTLLYEASYGLRFTLKLRHIKKVIVLAFTPSEKHGLNNSYSWFWMLCIMSDTFLQTFCTITKILRFTNWVPDSGVFFANDK